MSAATPIAMLVEAMLAGGADHSAVVHAVEAAELDQRAKPYKSQSGRGSQLSNDWQPNDADVAYATALQVPESLIALEAEKFRNYWTAKAGAGATKRDW